MKYIHQPPAATESEAERTRHGSQRSIEHLQKWAKGGRLVTAAFFFWNSGVELQTSKEGLMRTLLHQILFQATDLIPHLSPRTWEALCLFDHDALEADFTDAEVRQFFNRLLEILPPDIRLCCFVDGLDEFQGDPALVIDFATRMMSNPNIKMCVASRPWTEFEDAFHQDPGLLLEDLTREDIKSYTASRLMKEVAFCTYHQLRSVRTEEMIDYVVNKASGVFLWVRLVVNSLIDGLRDGDRLSDLQRRLEELPDELEDLFERMIDTLKPKYLAHAATIFELMRTQSDPPGVLELSFADEESLPSALRRSIRPLKDDEAAMIYESLRRRLKSRTMGLLEVSSLTGADLDTHFGMSAATVGQHSVHYLHRTVKDYLNKGTVHARFQEVLDPGIDLHLSMCIGQLCAVKAMQDTRVVPTISSRRFYNRVRFFMHHASRVREEFGVIVVQLMDDLDRSARAIISRTVHPTRILRTTDLVETEGYLTTREWPEICTSDSYDKFPPDLLSLACTSGIAPYVATRAASKTRGSPPLLCWAMTAQVSTADDIGRSTPPSVPLINCLLTKGYTLDESLQASPGWSTWTGWERLFSSFIRCPKAEDETIWLQVAELAFRAGSRLPSKASLKRVGQYRGDFNGDAQHYHTAYAKLEKLYRSIPQAELPSRMRLEGRKLKRLFSRTGRDHD